MGWIVEHQGSGCGLGGVETDDVEVVGFYSFRIEGLGLLDLWLLAVPGCRVFRHWWQVSLD